NVSGPMQSVNKPYPGAAASCQSRSKNGQPPVVFEDGNQTRDFVSVHDVVRSCILAMNTDGADYHAVNVGTGRGGASLHVAQVLLTLDGSELRPTVEPRVGACDGTHAFAGISLSLPLVGDRQWGA